MSLYRFARVAIAATLFALPLSALADGVDSPSHAAMRGYGDVTVTNRDYRSGSDRSSWITFTAEDADHAAVVGSKFKADLLGFGDLKARAGTGLPGSVVALDGTGLWLIALNGNRCEVLFARTQAALAGLAKTAGAAAWKPVPDRAYPRWLDCFDNAGTGVWWGGGGAPTHIPNDFQWAKDRGFTLTDQPPTESRYVAPGVIDNSITDWFSAMCRKYDIPYRTLLWGQKPEWAWNRIPLPYVRPTGYAVAEPDFREAKWSVYDSFEPVPATLAYSNDFRKLFAANLDADPNYLGGHALGEVPDAGVAELASVGGSPEMKALWHSYLVQTLGPDLAKIGRMHKGDPAAYTTWDDVQVPNPNDFIGFDASSVNLVGTWDGMADRAKAGTDAKWYAADGAPKQGWTPINCNDPVLMMYGGGNPVGKKDSYSDYWLRRTFTLSADQASSLKFLHVIRAVWHGQASTFCDAYINGQPLEQAPKGENRDISLCFAAGSALHAGENTIVLCCHGSQPAGLIALTGTPFRRYPFMTDPENRLWYDATNFSAWLRMRNLEYNLQATRAADPNRPLKVMATINMLDMSQELCAKYGAYQHDTGGAGGYWCPMSGARLARTHGLPWSCEQGGPPADAAAMQSAMTFYLMYGNDAVDLVFGVTHYADNKPVADWVDHNNALMHCIGKLDMPQPPVAILRSTRATRLGFGEPWSWDLGRGGLQGVGRNFTYVEIPDIASGLIERYPVIVDDGTVLMTDDEVDGLIKYVKAGGIFIAQHLTGMHSPEHAYSWPISRLTGLSVSKNTGFGMNMKFTSDESLWPNLRGKQIRGWGMVLDYRNRDLTGQPIGLEKAANDIDVIAEWADAPAGQGKIAIARRRLGRGQVITLGSTFWRDSRDAQGMYRDTDAAQNVLDEMLTSLGVPRDSWTGDQGLWAERWLSKNGVYDLYPTARMVRTGDPMSETVTVRRDTAPTDVVEVTADGHPKVAAKFANGKLTFPQAGYTAMQTRIYAAPRPDAENAPLRWFAVQSRQWRALPPLSPLAKPDAVPLAEDVVPAAEGWKMSTTQTDPSWIQPGFADTSWKTVRLGTFAALGLPDDSAVQFRKAIAVPESWKGRRVNLVFNTEWSYGIDRGKIYVNGQPALGGQAVKAYGNSNFVINVTDAAATGSVTVALDLDGHLANPADNRSRPAGVTGIFYLEAIPKPVQSSPLPNPWMAATDANVFTVLDSARKVRYSYLETKFTLPKPWPSKRVFLESPDPLGALMLNGTLVETPGWMNRLDITGLVRADGQNVLRWAPRGSSNFKAANNDPAPKISLSWMP